MNDHIAKPVAFAGAVLAASPAAVMAQTAPAATPIRVPTVETLAQFPGMTGFQISPDGKHMIALQSQGDNRSILVWKLADLAAHIGDRQVRNRGTLGGSLANNDPAADYPSACLALGATIKTDKDDYPPFGWQAKARRGHNRRRVDFL